MHLSSSLKTKWSIGLWSFQDGQIFLWRFSQKLLLQAEYAHPTFGVLSLCIKQTLVSSETFELTLSLFVQKRFPLRFVSSRSQVWKSILPVRISASLLSSPLSFGFGPTAILGVANGPPSPAFFKATWKEIYWSKVWKCTLGALFVLVQSFRAMLATDAKACTFLGHHTTS